MENTGGTTIGGDVCCIAADTRTANGECLVTTAHQAGTRYEGGCQNRRPFAPNWTEVSQCHRQRESAHAGHAGPRPAATGLLRRVLMRLVFMAFLPF